MRVNQYLRAHVRMYSMDRVFSTVRSAMPPGHEYAALTCPSVGRDWPGRIQNLRWVSEQLADVHHVTGDAHYLTFGLPQCRTVLTIHDCGRISELAGLRRFLYRKIWFDESARRAKIVTVISEFTKEQVGKLTNISSSRIKVIYNPIMPGFTYSPKEFNKKSPKILQIGTAGNKNVERLITALSGLRCQLLIVGLPTAKQERLLKDNSVQFEVRVGLSDEELRDCYRESDLVTFCSTYEGFGMPVTEAQAIGRPLVASNVTSIPEIGGAGAQYIDPFSVDSIRSGVLRVIESPTLRDEIVGRGLDNIRRFDPVTTAGMYLECYENVMRS